MNDQSGKTIKTYRENFHKYIERTPAELTGAFKEWVDLFLSYVPEGGAVLEWGSASGRDARYMAAKKYNVICTDVIPEALQKLSEQGFEVREFDLRNKPVPEWTDRFDGLFANAVLLHAPQDVFEYALKNIGVVLKDGGIAAFSLKTGEGEEITYEKMDAPRYFRYHSEREIREILPKLSFEIISLSPADQGKWLQVIMRKV